MNWSGTGRNDSGVASAVTCSSIDRISCSPQATARRLWDCGAQGITALPSRVGRTLPTVSAPGHVDCLSAENGI